MLIKSEGLNRVFKIVGPLIGLWLLVIYLDDNPRADWGDFVVGLLLATFAPYALLCLGVETVVQMYQWIRTGFAIDRQPKPPVKADKAKSD